MISAAQRTHMPQPAINIGRAIRGHCPHVARRSGLGRPPSSDEDVLANLAQTLLGSLLASAEPIYLLWGQDRIFSFNAAYSGILGPRLDTAMAARSDQVWANAYLSVGPPCLGPLYGRSSQEPTAKKAVSSSTGWSRNHVYALPLCSLKVILWL